MNILLLLDKIVSTVCCIDDDEIGVASIDQK